MTAPDPRLGEIEAAEALVHVKCVDCAKCRIAEEDCWCPECEYWGCEQGPDCEDDPKPTDVAYLLAELRKRDEALARVEAVAADLADRGGNLEAKGNNGSIYSTRAEGRGIGYREGARLIRAAVAGADS